MLYCFAPPSPKTKPKLEKAREYESRLNVEELVRRAVENTVVEEITPNYVAEEVENSVEMDDCFNRKKIQAFFACIFFLCWKYSFKALAILFAIFS